jgi:vacuolar-type H+-ATPase catalytic subunit A/Vma1
VGDRITGGDIYGLVHENSMIEHRIMLPPGARGNISYIAPAGSYNINEEIIEVEFQGQKKVRTAGQQQAGLLEEELLQHIADATAVTAEGAAVAA